LILGVGAGVDIFSTHTRKTVAISFMSRVGLLGFVNYLLESENNIRDSMSMEKADGKRERAKKDGVREKEWKWKL